MKKWLIFSMAVLAAMTMAVSVAAEANEVLRLDFSDGSQVKADDKSMPQGEVEIDNGLLVMSGWRPGGKTSAGYVKTEGILPAPDNRMGTLTLEFEFIPRDISWTVAKAIIGDQGNGTEQDALILEILGNDLALEKRGALRLNMGGVVTDLGEFNTGELMADATYAVRVYKDNSTGTAELYFYDKDGKVPAEPVLTVQSDVIKSIVGNISFTSYAGRYDIDNVVVYDGESPRPTAPTTTTKATTEVTATTKADDSATIAPVNTPSGSLTTASNGGDSASLDGGNTALIVVLCVAGVIVIAAAVAITLVYRSSITKKDGTDDQG